MSITPSLVDRHTDATQKLILATALDLLERSSVGELTVRAVAKEAGISERTIFRYHASRDDFLDAVAQAAARSLQTPPPPARLEDLPEYPRVLYTRFEERAGLVKSALHTEIFERMRVITANERWRAVKVLIDERAGHRSEHDRKIAAANLCYYLAATTWHYYRFYFGFTLEDAIEAARSALRLVIDDVMRPDGAV
ncbi:TetR/AcrR family transcriptional regulator [Azospirillum sp. sgz302134]